jgi:PAS domain S-box-containing protein
MDRLLTLLDATPIKEAEERAREAENRLMEMTDSMPGMVFQYLWKGPDNGRFVYASKGVEKIFGVTSQEIVEISGGGNRLFGFTEEARLQFVHDIAKHAQNLEPVDLEVKVSRDDGQHYLQVRGNFILQNDNSRILNGVIQDITTLKIQEFELRSARQAAEEAMQIRSRFLATMSHELRTPISGMHGMLELLHMTDLSDEQKFMVRNIKHSTNTLLYLVNDLLDFSKIEAGELQLQYQPCQLQSTICDVMRGHATTATGKNLAVNIYWDAALPWMATIDPIRVGQIISNLLNNAVKFTHRGSITLTARYVTQDHLAITVSDTGIGIPQDKQHRLFTPFEQIESDITRRYGGTGLGLAICDQLIKKMNGTLSMESIPNGGSAFTFTIPLSNCRWQDSELAGSEWWVFSTSYEKYSFLHDMGATLKRVQSLAELEDIKGFLLTDEDSLQSLTGDNGLSLLTSLPLSGIIFSGREPLRQRINSSQWWRLGTSPLYPDLLQDTCKQLLFATEINTNPMSGRILRGRILVADDHPINREVMARQLAMFNLDTVLVNDGDQALLAWSEQNFDLLLTDLHMPVMDGNTLTRTLRNRSVTAPIIGITADITVKTIEQMRNSGMSDILEKPYSMESLYQALSRALPHIADITYLPEQPYYRCSEVQDIAQCWLTLFGNDTLARSMAEEYIRTNQEDCLVLEKALAFGKTEVLSEIAHRLKGTAKIANHRALEKKAAYLEDVTQSASEETLQVLVQSIQSEVNRYSQQVGAWIHE